MLKRPAFCALVLVAAAACSTSGGVQVDLDEYSIDAAPREARAGLVTFTATNQGEIAHQLLVLRTRRRPGSLPVRSGVVQTLSRGIELVGKIDLVAPDDAETLTVRLSAGDYVLICNIAGHYPSGMRAPFRVSRAMS